MRAPDTREEKATLPMSAKNNHGHVLRNRKTLSIASQRCGGRSFIQNFMMVQAQGAQGLDLQFDRNVKTEVWSLMPKMIPKGYNDANTHAC